MAKITINGIKYGNKVEVVCEELSNRLMLMFNGKKDTILEYEFRQLMLSGTCSMGNYYPTDDSILSAYIVLMTGFFDKEPNTAIIEGDIGEIPTEESPDIVY